MRPPVFGIAGWKNSGKTTMAARLVTELTGRGFAITAIKHAHESFDIDHPGRDSYRLREAGARRVVLSSPKRWALMHELGDSPEMSFKDVLSEAGTCDLILVEGLSASSFRRSSFAGRAVPRGSRSLACRKLSQVPRTGLAMRPSPSLSFIWMIYEEFPISLPDVST